MEQYLKETRLLDFHAPVFCDFVRRREWLAWPEFERIGGIYDYVRNEIPFGYNHRDDIPASCVFEEGYGQCNTKGTLFMALLRKCGIPCRFHAFTVDKRLQKGIIPPLAYALAPCTIIHSWVEIFRKHRWVAMEGVILDRAFLEEVQKRFLSGSRFWGYAVATDRLANPPIEWNGSDTYIQKDAILGDLGIYDSPDVFYRSHGANLSGVKALFYRYVVRKRMNARVSAIRQGRW
jgi:hypothetical protein